MQRNGVSGGSRNILLYFSKRGVNSCSISVPTRDRPPLRQCQLRLQDDPGSRCIACRQRARERLQATPIQYPPPPSARFSAPGTWDLRQRRASSPANIVTRQGSLFRTDLCNAEIRVEMLLALLVVAQHLRCIASATISAVISDCFFSATVPAAYSPARCTRPRVAI